MVFFRGVVGFYFWIFFAFELEDILSFFFWLTRSMWLIVILFLLMVLLFGIGLEKGYGVGESYLLWLIGLLSWISVGDLLFYGFGCRFCCWSVINLFDGFDVVYRLIGVCLGGFVWVFTGLYIFVIKFFVESGFIRWGVFFVYLESYFLFGWKFII